MYQRCLTCILLSGAALACFGQSDGPRWTVRDYCIKAQPGKGAEYDAYLKNVAAPLQQALADSGELVSWIAQKAVVPAGSTATCDYRSVYIYAGMPPEMPSPEKVDAALKRANIRMNAADLAAKRASLSTLVSVDYWAGIERAGSSDMQKNQYVKLNHYKVKSGQGEAWVKLETTYWKPIVEEYVKGGAKATWSVVGLMMPSGGDQPYNAMTVDVLPDWKAVVTGAPYELWSKVHPNTAADGIFEKLDQVRETRRVEVYQIMEVARGKSQGQPAGGK
jgi:hypothetical protein